MCSLFANYGALVHYIFRNFALSFENLYIIDQRILPLHTLLQKQSKPVDRVTTIFTFCVQRHGAGLEILSLGESKVRGSGQKDMQRENVGERGRLLINRRCFYDTLVSIA